jgi:hypothetical protein
MLMANVKLNFTFILKNGLIGYFKSTAFSAGISRLRFRTAV